MVHRKSLVSIGSTPIRAVLFDMDGLLLDTEVIAMQALLKAATDLKITMSDEFARSLIGLPYDACLRLTEERFGGEFDTNTLFARQALISKELMLSDGLKMKPGVMELLDLLITRNVRRAVVTSSRRSTTISHLRRVGLIHRFETLITRDDVTLGKPNPEPYLRAAEALGVSVDECLALEDSHNGARAAHAAKIQVIVVPDLIAPNKEILDKALVVLKDLHQVRTFITSQFKLSPEYL